MYTSTRQVWQQFGAPINWFLVRDHLLEAFVLGELRFIHGGRGEADMKLASRIPTLAKFWKSGDPVASSSAMDGRKILLN